MKKLLFILALGAFVACNDNTGGDEVETDTTTVTPAPAPEVVDTTNAPVGDTTVAQ